MPASNVSRFGLALQSAKGTRAGAPQYWLNFSGGNLVPSAEIERLAETGLGRDLGDAYITLISASGDPSVYLRPRTAALLAYGVLGAKAAANFGAAWAATTAYTSGTIIRPTNTGTNPYTFEATTGGTSGAAEPTWPTAEGATVADGSVTWTNRGALKYTHTLTVANDQPWFTVWFELGDSLYLVFDDCKITEMNIEAAAGGVVTAGLGITGLNWERLTSAVAGGYHDQVDAPFRVPGATYTIGGVADNSLTSMNLNIAANQTGIQTTKLTYTYLEPSTREISLGWEGVWVDPARWAQINTGSSTGTQPTETLYETATNFEFGKSYGPRLRLEVPRAQLPESGVAPDPGGDPLTLSVGGNAARPASGSITSIIVTNSVASYAAA